MPLRPLCALALLLALTAWTVTASAQTCTPAELAATLAGQLQGGDLDSEATEAEGTQGEVEQDGTVYYTTTCHDQGCAQSGAGSAPFAGLALLVGWLVWRRRVASPRP